MEKHRALSQEHYSKMDALEEAYQVNVTCHQVFSFHFYNNHRQT